MKYRLLVVLLLISTLTHAQSLNKGSVATRSYYAEIPYTYVKNKIIIPVEIEGNTYNFLLDTGAPNMILSSLPITTKPLGSMKINDANGQRTTLKIVAVPSLNVGGINFVNTSTLVQKHVKPDIIFDCLKIHGIIGSNMLRNSVLQILPREQKIIITNSRKKLQITSEKEKLFLNKVQSSPYLWIRMKGEKTARERVLIDTGDNGFYDLSVSNYPTFKKEGVCTTLAKSSGSSSIGLLGGGKRTTIYKVQFPEIRIGNASFTNPVISTTPNKRSRIGNVILDYGNVTLDFKKKHFYYDTFDNDPIDMNKPTFGIDPNIKDGKLIVGVVWDDTLKEQVAYGDKIIEVNGVNYSEKDICDIITQKNRFFS